MTAVARAISRPSSKSTPETQSFIDHDAGGTCGEPYLLRRFPCGFRHRRGQRAGPPLTMTLLPPGAGSLPHSAAAPRPCRPTTALAPCRRYRARRSPPEAGPSRTTPRRDPRPPSAPSAADGSRPSCRARGTGVPFSAVPTARRGPALERRRGRLEKAARNAASRAASRRTPGSAPRPASRTLRIASAVRALVDGEDQRASVGASATSRGSGRTNSTPRRSSCMSRTTDGRSGPIACASDGSGTPARFLRSPPRRRRRPGARARAASVRAFAR